MDKTPLGDSVVVEKGNKTSSENSHNKTTINSTIALVGVLFTGIAGVLGGVYLGQGSRQPPVEVTRIVEATRQIESTRIVSAAPIKETVVVKEAVPVPVKETVVVKQTVEVPQTVVVKETVVVNNTISSSSASLPAQSTTPNLIYEDSGVIFTVREARYTSKSRIKVTLTVIDKDSESKYGYAYVGTSNTFFISQDGVNFNRWVTTVGSGTCSDCSMQIDIPKGVLRIFDIEFYEVTPSITNMQYLKIDTSQFGIKKAPEFRNIPVKPN